jgi:hypothetical protein
MKDQKMVKEDFSVALLMQDIVEAKELSDVLREMGIYAHLYQNLDEFWVAVNAYTPDFAIIDVTKMSQSNLTLRLHPKIEDGSLCFAFYYNEDTQLLLNSTHKLNHYGFVKKEVNLDGQLKAILRRRNLELHLIKENENLNERIDRLQKRSQKIIESAEVSYMTEQMIIKSDELIQKIDNDPQEDFHSKLVNLFSEWEACSAFTIYQLNPGGHKLVVKETKRNKFHRLPDLWIGKNLKNGIESFALDMAEQVAFDTFGKNFRTIRIHGIEANPDIVILANFNEKELAGFRWRDFADKIADRYRYDLVRSNFSLKSQSFISFWEAMAYLDDIHYHQKDEKHKLININLKPLMKFIMNTHQSRFYWKSFFADFIFNLAEVLDEDSLYSNSGAWDYLVFINKSKVDSHYHGIKEFVRTFEYWRYFEDSSAIFKDSAIPQITMIAPSSINYMRSTERSFMKEEDLPEIVSIKEYVDAAKRNFSHL